MKLLRFFLFPLSLIYAAVVLTRNFFYDIGIFSGKSYSIALIGVGNLSMGGTGKSPHVEYLIDFLGKKIKVASLSRGYGRKTSGFIEVKESSTFIEVGDEPRAFKSKFKKGIIAVDANRRRGIDKLLDIYPEIKCIILDDSYQHRAVIPGMNILLTDYSKLYIDDFILPTGNLREPKIGSNRADIIIVSKCPTIFSPIDARGIRKKLRVKPYQAVYFSYFKYDNLKPVYHNEHPNKVEFKQDTELVLLTGIAKSSNLLYHVKEKVNHVKHLRFGDHHIFSINDIQHLIREYDALKGQNKIILTTEKDAMRLHMPGIVELIGDLPVYYIPIKVEFHGKDKQDFQEQITKYVKRYSKAD